MNKEMIISANAHEKRVAILEDGVVVEFYVERADETKAVVGNIYKGKVRKVLPGMQSAFVDIGLERDAFLYVSDFFDEEELGDDLDMTPAGDSAKASRQEPAGKRDQEERRPEREGGKRDNEERRPERDGGKRDNEERRPERDGGKRDNEERRRDRDRGERRQDRVSGRRPAPDDEKSVASTAPSPVVAENEAPVEAASEAVIAETPSILETPLLASLLNADGEGFERINDDDVVREEPVVVAEPVLEAAEPVAEPEEPKRGRRGKKKEAAPVEEKKKPARRKKKGEDAEAAPVQVEPVVYERIEDDDSEFPNEAAELLKEALIQEKIIEQTRIDEISMTTRAEDAVQFEPVKDDEQAEAGEPVVISYAPVAETPNDEETPAEGSAEVGVRDGNPEFAARRGRRGRRRGRGPNGNGESSGDETDASATPEDSSEVPVSDAEVEEIAEEILAAVEEASPVIAVEDVSEIPIPTPVVKEGRPPREPREPRESREPRENREPRETREPRENKDNRPPRENRENRDNRENRENREPREPRRQLGIADLLREGQEIIVQIAKEPIGLKGARITSYVALPGRYLVYMPTINHIGVSRKVSTEQERIRLKKTMQMLREREGVTGGFIVRTACEGHTEQELCDDMLYLARTWRDIRKRSDSTRPGTVLCRELDLVQRLLRDHMSSDFMSIRVDNEEEYTRIVDFINRFQPKLVNRVKLYTRRKPIFEEYNVQPEIDAALKPRVWLKSGGFIVINQTEALVAIDVNTGKFVGRSNRLEDTITRTNIEAASEIVRQIRLRDLGGIIVLDFIDMEDRRNRQKVMQVLEQAMKSDRSPSKITQFNDFGLVAVTRKRVRQSLERTLSEPCHYCGGSGQVKSPQTVCYEILAQARNLSGDMAGERHSEITLRVNPVVAEALRGAERQVWREVNDYFGMEVSLQSDPLIHQERFDFAMY